ncbi:LytTR family transcriptional regulator DNA-binding domain-containing protein [Anaerosacchariphilus polymeriproducens]
MNGYFTEIKNDKQIVSKLPLKDYENMLDKDLFYRCHRNAILDVSYVD